MSGAKKISGTSEIKINMTIKEITNKATWNTFFNSVGSPSFHHSWEWGEFQKSMGYSVLRVGIYDKENLTGIALVIKIRSKRGNFLFVPHGPLFSIASEKLMVTIPANKKQMAKTVLSTLTNYLTDIAKTEDYWFIRVAPVLADSSDHKDIFNKAGYKQAPIYVHAESMWAVDISGTEDEIMQGMRKTTRYLIRKGLKEGIEISKYSDIAALDEFWKLYEVTFSRESFTPFPKKFILKEFQVFNVTNNSLFFLGGIPQKFAQGSLSKFQAGSLVLFTKSSGFYHQGASIHSTYPVTYVLQWNAMLEAKRRGCKFYNFYGIYKPGRTPNAWKGLSLFKQGFGGFQIDYLPTQDYIVSPKYYFSFAIDKYLSFKRGI